MLLALNQMSLDKYLGDLKPGGVLLVDADLVQEVPLEEAVAIPFTRLAREMGKEMMANIVALGALAAITKAVSPEGLQAAVLARVPPQTRELNQKALEAGLAAGKVFLEKAALKRCRDGRGRGIKPGSGAGQTVAELYLRKSAYISGKCLTADKRR